MDELDSRLYTVAWIAPLQIEARAALAMLDHHHEGRFPMARGDDYVFIAGDLRGHNIIIATLPEGQAYGTGSAAALTSQIKKNFPNLWFGLLVGVAAGLPDHSQSTPRDIRLGDVLVGLPTDRSSGIVAYDLGKETGEDGFQPLRPGHLLRTTETAVLSAIGTIRHKEPNEATVFLPFYERIRDKEHASGTFIDPGQEKDVLYELDAEGEAYLVKRERRQDSKRTRVWYGPIGSEEKLMKNAQKRNALRDRYGLIGLEMEAAGTMISIPVGVIRGVCDYGDERKNKEWQPYAAAMAAAYATAILNKIGVKNIVQSPSPSPSSSSCLQSLAFLNMDERSLDIEDATEGTCKWLLQHETYKSWAATNRSLLWIEGKPGSGKSTLLKHVLNDNEAMAGTEGSCLKLSFFFHGRGDELQRTPLGLFRSLLHQALSLAPGTLTRVVDAFEKKVKEKGEPGVKWQWHREELWSLFKLSLLNILKTQPVCLLVDALDECGKKNADELVQKFQSLLQGLPLEGLKQCRICFTCRHYPILHTSGAFQISLDDENEEDISTFVRKALSRFDSRSTIPALISDHAKGVFLWARLVTKIAQGLVLEGKGPAEIEAEIKCIPAELNQLYRDLIKGMGLTSLRLIQWICFATRPLSVDELRWAMIIDPDYPSPSLKEYHSMEASKSDNDSMKRQIQTLSCGLVEVIQSSNAQVVQFIHQSVMDFFVEGGLLALDSGSASIDSAVGTAHHRLAKICIQYLHLAMVETDYPIKYERSRLMFEFPLLYYATTAWTTHMKQSDARSTPQEDLLEYFSGLSSAFIKSWTRIYNELKPLSYDTPSDGTALIHLLSRFGVIGLLTVVLPNLDKAGFYIDTKSSRWTRPRKGVKLLSRVVIHIFFRGNTYLNVVDRYGRTPLMYAAQRGHEAIAWLLLEKGARIEAVDKDGQTPLMYAALGGYEAVARLLLDKGARIEAVDTDGQTPLMYAALGGYEAMARLLLNKGARIEAVDTDGRTPLVYTALGGQETIARLLLEKDARIEAVDRDGRTPLIYAAWEGHEAVARLLLKKGARIETVDRDGWTPLIYTAWEGHEAVAWLLLDKGARIEAVDTIGRTPLIYAAQRGHEAVARLLLDKGARIEIVDRDGQTPLMYAALGRHEAVARLLLDKGARIEAVDTDGRTPLMYAALGGHEAVARLLLDKGAQIEAVDTDGQTPLMYAALGGHEAVARLLLDKGARIEAVDTIGRTPLIHAALRGHEAVARLLLDKGARIEAVDTDGQTPLIHATREWHEAVARLLLDKGARIPYGHMATVQP